MQVSQPSEQSQSSEFKVKTLDEIRAEKMAKNQVPKDESTTIEDILSSSTFNSKRPAPQTKKQIRIKRPKISVDPDADVQVPNTVTENAVANTTESSKPAVISHPESTEAEDDLDDDGSDGTDNNTGLLNEDELLLEIDNILGD